jgi:DNA polymerase
MGAAEAEEQPARQRAERPERPGAEKWVPRGAGVGIDDLRRAAEGCRGCELYEDAIQVVFSSGSPSARMMLVGEQPGDQEDRQGVPFVGPAGKLLQKALREAEIHPETVYLTNSVKHFRFAQEGPGKRRIHKTPDLAHMVACAPWLDAELALVDPDVVVCLGSVAAKSLLGKDFKVTKERGVVIERELANGPMTFVATVHPSAILRRKGADRDTDFGAFVADLRVAREALAA